MSSLNINSLFEEQDKKVLNRLKMFDDILLQIHNKIKLNSQNKTFFCTHEIPEFLIGKPLYKIEDLRKYLIDSLKRDKFDVLYIHPNLLFISWERLKNNKSTQINFIKSELEIVDQDKLISTILKKNENY